MAGHEWVMGEESTMSASVMCKSFIRCINTCLEKWTPRKRFTLYSVKKTKMIEQPGVIA